uniref:(northern house mosquito) hypothetical protein n=1 Tax=Culex pipiens TaxID=7175 RepID=A0A8D8AEV1_CULPI
MFLLKSTFVSLRTTAAFSQSCLRGTDQRFNRLMLPTLALIMFPRSLIFFASLLLLLLLLLLLNKWQALLHRRRNRRSRIPTCVISWSKVSALLKLLHCSGHRQLVSAASSAAFVGKSRSLQPD